VTLISRVNSFLFIGMYLLRIEGAIYSKYPIMTLLISLSPRNAVFLAGHISSLALADSEG
jgi:hypothetical protein